GVTSSSTSFVSHSSSRSGLVSASQTSSGSAGRTSSLVTSIPPPSATIWLPVSIGNSKVANLAPEESRAYGLIDEILPGRAGRGRKLPSELEQADSATGARRRRSSSFDR